MLENHGHSVFSKIKSYLLLAIVFLFPLLFVPVTQEYFLTTKFYFLAFSALVLLGISTIELLVTRTYRWSKKPFDSVFFLFIVTLGLSTLIVSPNKIQALLNPNFGLVIIVSLTILSYYISRNLDRTTVFLTMCFSSAALSVVAFAYLFQPFKNAQLPLIYQFLKNAGFTPIGGQLDLAIFLGFSLILILGMILNLSKKTGNESSGKMYGIFLVVFGAVLVGFLSTLYTLVKVNPLILPPANLSWYAAVETMKNPINAVFGIGMDNYAVIFTRVKDSAYNQTSLWQANSFAVSRSALLQVFTEAGIFGFIAFVGIIFFTAKEVVRHAKHHLELILGGIYLLVVMLFFPISMVTFFLVFVYIAVVPKHEKPDYEVDMRSLFPLVLIISVISFLVIGCVGFLLVQTYRAEYYFRLSLNGFANNNIKDLYDNQRQAILINPYIERYRTNFAQTNLIIANNIAAKAQPKNQEQTDNQQPGTVNQQPTTKNQLSEQDRQTISQAVQAAIGESKAVVALNPQKAGNWETLALIYRNILGVAQGADVWTISAYQRAIVLDPQNPIYRLNLGGVYYSLEKYDEAQQLFQQAVALKPDWPNAQFNLAWAAYQKGDYPTAVSAMQSVLQGLDPNKDKKDYDRAKKDLEEFKKKLPTEETNQPATNNQEPNKIGLPTPPANNIDPKINLPKTASPEAR